MVQRRKAGHAARRQKLAASRRRPRDSALPKDRPGFNLTAATDELRRPTPATSTGVHGIHNTSPNTHCRATGTLVARRRRRSHSPTRRKHFPIRQQREDRHLHRARPSDLGRHVRAGRGRADSRPTQRDERGRSRVAPLRSGDRGYPKDAPVLLSVRALDLDRRLGLPKILQRRFAPTRSFGGSGCCVPLRHHQHRIRNLPPVSGLAPAGGVPTARVRISHSVFSPQAACARVVNAIPMTVQRGKGVHPLVKSATKDAVRTAPPNLVWDKHSAPHNRKPLAL